MMKCMRKLTERYDLVIPCTDENDVKNSLQKACEKNDTYPIKICKNNGGFVVSFLRNPAIPQYLYISKISSIINAVKMELAITTIVCQKKQGYVNTDHIPKEKKSLVKETATEASESAAAMIKKLNEDNNDFNIFTNKQILEADYDTREGREADRHAIRTLRNKSKLHVFVSESASLEGQLAFDLSKYLS